MKVLNDILIDVPFIKTYGSTNRQVSNICFDSRRAEKNCLFIAVKGTIVNGHDFISQAIDKGASSIICEDLPKDIKEDVTYIIVEDSALSLSLSACEYFDNPSRKLKLIGITGTNGKTTVATLLFKLYRELGYSVGLISTIHIRIDDQIVPTSHTTPDSLELNRLLDIMSGHHCEYVFMEVSSHAICQKRIAGLRFKGGVFTNITHDHLDYHSDFKEYIIAKQGFFNILDKQSFALVNADDKHHSFIVQNTEARILTFSLQNPADFKAKIIENQIEGMNLLIDKEDVWFKLIGRFNAYNIISVYGTAILLGTNSEEILPILSNIDTVEGRFDVIRSRDGKIIIIDYAHTPDAIRNILNTIAEIRNGNEEIISVFGAGGNRDKEKRPEMGKIAGELSTRVILTSDNPRDEKTEDIIQDIKKGISGSNLAKVISITDRREAIKTGIALARPGDFVVIAGKGHEKLQEIKGEKHPFDDKKVAIEFLENEIK